MAVDVMEAAVRARVAISLEAARDALHRRKRTRDGSALERALYSFVADVFRAQGRGMDLRLRRSPIDPRDPSAEHRMSALWEEVAAEIEPVFREGMTQAEIAGMALGAARLIEAARDDVSEAVGAYAPPPAAVSGFGQKYDPASSTGLRPDLRGTPFAQAFPQAAGAANRHAATLVRNVDDETRRRLRGMVAQARTDQVSADVLARRIRQEYPYMAVGSPLGHIQSRAHLIAVTETTRAYEKGQRYVAGKSADMGLRMVKSWLTVGDGHVDPTCSDNEAAGEIPYDESFPSLVEEPPAHPGCRCTTQYRALTTSELGIDNPFAPGGRLDLIAPAVQAVAAGEYRKMPKWGTTNPGRRLRKPTADYVKAHPENRGDATMGAMNKISGADGLPTLVDSVTPLVDSGWKEMWRGVHQRRHSPTGLTYAEDFQRGEFFPGLGIYGNGTYAAGVRAGRSTAVDYAGGHGSGGEVMRMALNPKARVKRFKFGDDRALTYEPDNPFTSDWGRQALSQGYDAIHVVGSDYYVILNRTAVAVEKVIQAP